MLRNRVLAKILRYTMEIRSLWRILDNSKLLQATRSPNVCGVTNTKKIRLATATNQTDKKLNILRGLRGNCTVKNLKSEVIWPKRAASILLIVGKCDRTWQQSARTGQPWTPYITKYRPLESLGFACRYLEVVATDAWPKVWLSKWMGAPRFSAWLAWQCRNQWALVFSEIPARLAASFLTHERQSHLLIEFQSLIASINFQIL